MRKLFIILAILCFASNSYGAFPPVNWIEQDGSPSVFPTKVRFPNTSLSNTATGLVVTFSGGGSGDMLKATYDTDVNNIVDSCDKIGTLTTGKWCIESGGKVVCTENAPAGAGDVTDVGDCTGGACLDGTSDGGTYISFYDPQGAGTLIIPDIAGAVTWTLPTTGGTLIHTEVDPTVDTSAEIQTILGKADTSTNGYLWSTDWNTFNDKMAGTLAKDLVTTTPLAGGTNDILPGADADITLSITKADTSTNGYLWSTDWNTFNDKMAGTLAKDLVTTAPLTGGTDNILPGADADITIAIPKADTTTNGYLWSTDWTTFNAKQATIANYVGTVADGTGIDGTASGAGSTYTPTFDATELGNLTWGSGAGIVWTIDLATDVTMTWTTAKTTFSGTVDVATLTEGTNAVYNSTETPGGELGGTWASPTIDDSVAVTSWNLTTPTITTSLTTSTPTTLSAAELDRLDGLAGIITTDVTACTDLEGVGLVIDTAVLKFAPAEVIAPTWGAGAQQVWTFDLATDYTVTWTTGLATFSGDITVSGGDIKSGNIAFTIGDATTDTIALTTDGTGNGELTLPADSLGLTDIDWGTGAGQVPLSKSFQLSGTISTASDYGTLWKTPVAITITSVNVTATGTSWSATCHLDECDANGANCAGVDGATDITVTSGTNAADDASLSNPSIDANDWVGFHITATTWTTGGVMGVTFNYTQ